MYSEEMTLARMVERRRDLHRYPETGWAEYRTTSKIAEALAAAGMDIRYRRSHRPDKRDGTRN